MAYVLNYLSTKFDDVTQQMHNQCGDYFCILVYMFQFHDLFVQISITLTPNQYLLLDFDKD
jgi:hypothetical protein